MKIGNFEVFYNPKCKSEIKLNMPENMELKQGLVIEREAQLIKVLTEDNQELRGIPRGKVIKKEKIWAGDRVLGFVTEDNLFAIEEIQERKNLLIRPKIANVDRAIVVVTIKEPEFQNFLLDNILVLYEKEQVESVIVFNKIDLIKEEKERKELLKWKDIYEKVGYKVLFTSALTGEGIDELIEYLEGDICVMAGPSGVGKSALLSKITGVPLKSGELSRKTKRGRHTSRGVKLIPFGKGSFLADSPGFSKVEAKDFVEKKEIKEFFPEFLNYTCKFVNCMHVKEIGCEVKEALKRGEISCERYKSYLKMLETYVEDLSELCKESD